MSGLGESVRLGRKGDDHIGLRIRFFDPRSRLRDPVQAGQRFKEEMLRSQLQEPVRHKPILRCRVALRADRPDVRKYKCLPCRLLCQQIGRVQHAEAVGLSQRDPVGAEGVGFYGRGSGLQVGPVDPVDDLRSGQAGRFTVSPVAQRRIVGSHGPVKEQNAVL